MPSLIFTDGKVEVFIGSYGDREEGLHMNLGRLDVYFKIDLFGLNLGMCSREQGTSFLPSLLIILGGPIASLLIAVPLAYLAFSLALPQLWIFLIGVFAIAAIIDFFVNIFPNSSPIRLSNGSSIYNDGMSIYQLITRQFQSSHYFELETLQEEERYNDLIDRANDILLEGNDPAISRLLIQAYLKKQDYDNVISVYEDFRQDHKMLYNDHLTIGMAHKAKGNYFDALKNFDHCFHENPMNSQLNQAIGEIKADLGEHKRAIQRFTAAVYYDEENFLGYIERAKIYIKESMFDAAQQDLEMASNFEPGHFEIAYNLGIVYEKQRLYAKSVESLQKAEKLMPNKPGLAYKIELLKEHLPRKE
ncbi:hypothetical protein N9B82_02455 [Saprospiraceae bacterium]|nr:hypothetical protein [Saprospiraceae bacterium]